MSSSWFIISPNELDWGQPKQRWIFQKVNFSEDKSLKDFWAKHCRCVRLTLNKKRGNVTTEVKSSFMKMMKEFDAAEEVRPTKEDMLTMGENENNAYNTFCDYILPAVCGRKSNEAKFNKDYSSKVATASDEAFALLSIENAWDRWVFQLDNQESDHIPATRYSHEGSQSRALIYSGWKQIGTERFRDLQKLVKQDRTTCACDRLQFEILYLTKRQETSSKNRKCIRFRDDDHCSIENDLLEDIDAFVPV
eukprot:scaffold12431_cov57-Attheya_sp.AAC.3